MKDEQFDALATQALRPEDSPNEAVWAKVQPSRRAAPSFLEIGLAAAAGLVVLAAISAWPRSTPLAERTVTVRQDESMRDSFIAVTRVPGLPEKPSY